MIAPYVPEDFDAFWAELSAEAHGVPLNFRREPAPAHTTEAGHRVDRISFTGAQGRAVQGWIAYPPGIKRAPSFLWIPHYGRGSVPPDQYGTREGFTSLSFNFHGEDAFYEVEYRPEHGYLAEGAADPHTYIFRRMIQDVLVALRVLQAQSEADEDRIACAGLSQGGGMALWAATVSPIIRAVCADLPFHGAMPYATVKNAHRYPPKELNDLMEEIPLGRERVMHTLSYFDTLNLATRVNRPTQVSLGLKDPSCRPEVVRAIYQAVPCSNKRLIEYPGGHDFDPDMVGNNRDFTAEQLA